MVVVKAERAFTLQPRTFNLYLHYTLMPDESTVAVTVSPRSRGDGRRGD